MNTLPSLYPTTTKMGLTCAVHAHIAINFVEAGLKPALAPIPSRCPRVEILPP